MFSTTIKRAVATLGVVVGLVAAAGPASAQIPDGPVLAKAGPQPEAAGYLAADPSSEVDNQVTIIGSLKDTLVSGYNVNPPETVSSAIKGAAFRGEVTGLEPH